MKATKNIQLRQDENIGWYENLSDNEIPYFFLVGEAMVSASCTGNPIGDDEDLDSLAASLNLELPDGFFWTSDGDHFLCLATYNYEIVE